MVTGSAAAGAASKADKAATTRLRENGSIWFSSELKASATAEPDRAYFDHPAVRRFSRRRRARSTLRIHRLPDAAEAGVEPPVVEHRPQDIERVQVQLAPDIDAPDRLVTGEDMTELPHPVLGFANVEVQQLVQECSKHPRCRAQLPKRCRVASGDRRMWTATARLTRQCNGCIRTSRTGRRPAPSRTEARVPPDHAPARRVAPSTSASTSMMMVRPASSTVTRQSSVGSTGSGNRSSAPTAPPARAQGRADRRSRCRWMQRAVGRKGWTRTAKCSAQKFNAWPPTTICGWS